MILIDIRFILILIILTVVVVWMIRSYIIPMYSKSFENSTGLYIFLGVEGDIDFAKLYEGLV